MGYGDGGNWGEVMGVSGVEWGEIMGVSGVR